jgi:tRNA(Ile)-lysidine synthase
MSGDLDSLLARCTFPSAAAPVVCALSGGADSTAMTALAVDAGCDVTAVHVHHGLRPGADHDAEVAAASAELLGVRFECRRIELADGPNLEARARSARHVTLGPGALTGHTADDQAETLLLMLLRGAGATGLSAMTPGPTKPILGLRRTETVALCGARGLPVAIDPTNADPRFRRTRVRIELVPLLDAIAERDVTPLLVRTADHLRADDRFLDELASHLDATDATALASAPEPLARRALRSWLTTEGYPPDAAAIERVLAVARGRTEACEITGGRRVQRSGQRLRVFPGGRETR